MKRTLVVILTLALAACAPAEEVATASADAAPTQPSPVTAACAGSPAVGAYTTSVPTTHQMSVSTSCKITTSALCGSMDWQISGAADYTFATVQTVTLTQTGTWGAFNAYCLRPEFSPYTCNVVRFYDAGLGKYTLSMSCDHAYSKAWLAN